MERINNLVRETEKGKDEVFICLPLRHPQHIVISCRRWVFTSELRRESRTSRHDRISTEGETFAFDIGSVRKRCRHVLMRDSAVQGDNIDNTGECGLITLDQAQVLRGYNAIPCRVPYKRGIPD